MNTVSTSLELEGHSSDHIKPWGATYCITKATKFAARRPGTTRNFTSSLVVHSPKTHGLSRSFLLLVPVSSSSLSYSILRGFTPTILLLLSLRLLRKLYSSICTRKSSVPKGFSNYATLLEETSRNKFFQSFILHGEYLVKNCNWRVVEVDRINKSTNA